MRYEKDPPHIAVFLDGLNDLAHHLLYGNPAPLTPFLEDAWSNYLSTFKAGPPWVSFSENFPIFRINSSIRTHITYSGKRRKVFQNGVKNASKYYIANRNNISLVAREYNVKPIFFIQPVPRWTSEDRKKIKYRYYSEFINNVQKDTRDYITKDLSNVFFGFDLSKSTSIEHDGTHYTDIAATLLAKHMADVVVDNLPDSRD